MKDADTPEKKDIIDKLTSKQEGLMQAQKSLSSVTDIAEITGLPIADIEKLAARQ